MKRAIRFALWLVLLAVPPLVVVVGHLYWARGHADVLWAEESRISVETTSGPLWFSVDHGVPIVWPGDYVADALVKSEDQDFFQREGAFDFRALAGIAASVARGDGLRGGSTIPMQLSRVEHPEITIPERVATTQERRWASLVTRKFIEVRLGNRALRERGHREVLSAYASFVATPAPGVDSAAIREYGTLPEELATEQATALAALLPAPGRRIRDREEWRQAAARRDPDAIVPGGPALGTAYPMGSLQVHRAECLDQEVTRRAFIEAHRLVMGDPGIADVAMVVLREGVPLALVDSSRPGVRAPWAWSTLGKIRINSTIKVFWASEVLTKEGGRAGLSFALEHSVNSYFLHVGEDVGRTRVAESMRRHGIRETSGFSTLGRCWVTPIDLARATGACVSDSADLRRMLSEVPRRGTAASALREWPELPRTAWAKTGTSPHGRDFLIVGGDHELTVLIWAKATGPSDREAGPVLGPIFARVLRHLHHTPNSWPTFAHSSN